MNLQTIDKFKKRIITDIILLCYATKDHDMLNFVKTFIGEMLTLNVSIGLTLRSFLRARPPRTHLITGPLA